MSDNLLHRPLAIVDCQATGPNPARGQLLELAWATLEQPDAPLVVRGGPVALPAGVDIPRPVARITGLTLADLADAPTPRAAWSRFCQDLLALAPAAAPPPLLVIHYARYERAFLAALASEDQAGPDLTAIICTHEIARRLLPGLPRRGLHALAGFFGHHLPIQKRAADHVRATALIWRELIARLSQRRGVATEAQLRSWLERETPQRVQKKTVRLSQAQRLALPRKPGIYRLLGRRGEVLYVGKATSLRDRVSSHFTSLASAGEKNLELYTQVFRVDAEVWPSATEAALAEVQAIQSLRPPYNRSLLPEAEQVHYASRDLRSVRAAADAKHVLGPMTDAGVGLRVAALQEALGGKDIGAESLLALPADLLPSGSVLAVALARFAARHAPAPAAPPAVASLLRLGARLERQARLAEAAPDPPDAAEPDGSDWQLDPERVADALEWMLRDAARALRRGLFLSRLGSSCLVWRTAGGQKRMLLVSANRPAAPDSAPDGGGRQPACLSAPAPRAEPIADRATYDRLRVLGTELRRLCAQERPLILRLGTGPLLDKRRLARALDRF